MRTHALERSRWHGVVQRCTNPNHVSFGRYGGRGIGICPRWRESFSAFLEDMGPAPSADHSLDRIDNSKGYEPGNVRWATWTEQNRNKTNNRRVALGAEVVTQADLAERSGLTPSTIAKRLDLGWSPEEVLSRPAIKGNSANRKTHCLQGHEFSSENTRVRPDGARCCRTCDRDQSRERKRRRRAFAKEPQS